MRTLIHIILLVVCVGAKAQQDSTENLEINFELFFNSQKIGEIKNSYSIENDIIEISNLKYYISGISLINDSIIVWKESNSFHLLDIKNPNSFKLYFSIPKELQYDALHFQLGIDSLTNVSGVMGGDLDPTNGMYWSWQSGYINFKIEGTHSASSERNLSYKLHLGGYMAPYASIQHINIPTNTRKRINIAVQIAKLFSKIAITKDYRVMSPGEGAQRLSAIVASCFYEN